jgi:pantothenate kinase
MDSFNSRPHGTNAFLAGAVSASLMWSFASWYKSVLKGDKIQKREDDEKSVELHLHDDDIQKLTKHREESSPSSLICNPWKAKEAIQYRQLLELRESLIEHSKRTSLLLLDKILSQSQTFIGELPTRKRLRWPWESLRKHLSKENDSGNDGDGVHSSEHAAGKKTSTGGSEESFSSMDENPSIQNLSSDKSHSQQHDEERKEICIGSIFGLDVGGTLSKLVYFEKMRDDPNCAQKDQSSRSMWETFSDESTARRHSSINRDDLSRTNSAEHFRASSAEVFNFHESCSEDDLQSTTYPLHSPCNSPDLAMKRSHSLFDLTSKKAKREKALDRFYEFANRLDTYDTDVKDKSLSFYSRALGGEIHFIQFETRFLPEAMDLIKINDLHLNISKMGATGGGAHKYAGKWEQMLGIEIAKQDELDSLVAGMQFILSDVVGECYTLLPKSNIDTDKVHNEKTRDSNDIDTPQQNCPSVDDDPKDSNHPKPNEEEDKSTSPSTDEQSKEKNKCSDQYWWSRKVKRDFVAKNDSYPYLLVMIGTGVSVLRVDGPRKHERISGSSIGGGTYWGLCRLLTDVEHFDSVLNLAEKGDPSKVDM